MMPTEIVAAAIDPTNKRRIGLADLEATKNPAGEGDLVFVPSTRLHGVRRTVVWLVIDGHGYALNELAKFITPGLLWPREGNAATVEAYRSECGPPH